MPVLVIRRGDGWGDRFRSYDVLVDGARRGLVRAKQAISIELPAGEHTIELRIDLYSSPMLPVTLSEAGLTLECGPNRHPLLAGLALLKPRHWIYLRPVTAGP